MAAAAPATSAMPTVPKTHRHDRRQAGHREEHPDHRDKNDQRHDARLRQCEELPEPMLRKGERRHEVVVNGRVAGREELRQFYHRRTEVSDSGRLQQARQILGEPLDVGVGRV